MTLLRLVQRASILAGMTFASLSAYGNPAHADTPQFCAVTSNGQTACGTLKTIERLCVTTDGTNTICGKFKSFKPAGQGASIPVTPMQGIIVARKEVDDFMYTLKGCRKSDTTVKCELGITNKGKERSIYISPDYSNFIDPTGKSNQSSSTDLGGVANRSMTITPGIDYSASVTFSNVSEQVAKAQLLTIGTNNGRKVQFRNVPFTN